MKDSVDKNKLNKKTDDTFVTSNERPDVKTLLEKPVSELKARDMLTLLEQFGISQIGHVFQPDELLESTINYDDSGQDLIFTPEEEKQFEAMISELEKLKIPNTNFKTIPKDELITYVSSLQLEQSQILAVWGIIGRFKRPIDKALRDGKPRVDKVIRDNKGRADKAIREKAAREKAAVDKTVRDAKTQTDKAIREKINREKQAAEKLGRDTKARAEKMAADKTVRDKQFGEKDPAKEAADTKDFVDGFFATSAIPPFTDSLTNYDESEFSDNLLSSSTFETPLDPLTTEIETLRKEFAALKTKIDEKFKES